VGVLGVQPSDLRTVLISQQGEAQNLS